MEYLKNKEEVKQIFDARINDNLTRGEHRCSIGGREFIVLPNVFSPAVFPNTQWFYEQFLTLFTPVDSFLEIGAGVGHVLVEVCLSNKCKKVMGSDINEHAVECARQNLAKYGQSAEMFVSDVLDGIPSEATFDLIYWNCPFHFSEEASEEMDHIERSVRDPQYVHIEKLLMTAKARLNPGGRVMLSFSYQLGNFARLQQLLEKYGWNYRVAAERPADPTNSKPALEIFELSPL